MWQLMDVDVLVVGAGPTGLMLAGELGQAGMRTLLLERRREPSETPSEDQPRVPTMAEGMCLW